MILGRLPVLTWLALLGVLFACFFGLGSYPLLDNNEGMYAAIAKGMAQGGDLIIPHLNGVPYIEKPPMLYWLMAASFKLFGLGEWQARLPVALSLFGTLLASFFFLRVYAGERAARFVLLIGAGSPMWLMLGRLIFFDMLLAFFLSAALFSFYHWSMGARRRWLLLAYAATACAILTKGLVALVLIGVVALLFLWVCRTPLRRYLYAFDPLGIAIFLLIAVPWHVAASFREPDFAWYYFVGEHFLRFLNLREPHDYYNGPVWYYLPRLLFLLAPWSIGLPLLLRARPATPLLRFLWCWFGVTLVFFSLSAAKANYYMLAGLPPLVLLLALQLDALTAAKPRFMHLLLASILLLGTIALALFFYACPFQPGLQTYCAVLPPQKLGVAFIAAALGLCILWKAPRDAWGLALLLPLLFFWTLFLQGLARDGDRLSQGSVAHYLLLQKGPVALYRDFEDLSALAFYLPQPIPIVDSFSADLYYAQWRHLGAFYPLEEWLSHATPASRLIVSNQQLPTLQERLTHLKRRHVQIKPFTRVSILTFGTP